MKIGPLVSQSSRRRALAFTLAEALVAVAILGITFVGLYGGISFCFSVTQAEREDLRATQVMLERMEGIRLFNWDQVADPALNPTNFTERYYPGGGGQGSGLTYTGSVTLAPVTLGHPTYQTNMKELTVTVQWSSGNLQHTRSINTYIAKDGIQNYVWNLNRN